MDYEEEYKMGDSFWLWYPGDMELYYAMKQNFSRVERGMGWPAFWKSESFRNRVVFMRHYELAQAATFTVYSKAVGFVYADERKFPFGTPIRLEKGPHNIRIHCGRIDAFPSVYIEGDAVRSDKGWLVSDYDRPEVPAGMNEAFRDKNADPDTWHFSEKIYEPVSVTTEKEGFLYDFGVELTAVVEAEDTLPGTVIYCGESREEALDSVNCYQRYEADGQGRTERCAVRFVFISGERRTVRAIHQYVDIPVRASFSVEDARLTRIWEVSARTLALCSGIFFIDGIKRDRWIWGGDAYQSLQVNPYLFADPDIDRRTLTALRGSDPVTTHINTIADYSMLWLASVWDHYRLYGDREYLALMYPKMKTLMAFLLDQRDARGFFIGRPGDWLYIDWADFDREGPLGAEQMAFAGCWMAMSRAADALGLTGDHSFYENGRQEFRQAVRDAYWDEEKGAFVDSFASGRRRVGRQTNIFALRFGVASEEERGSILRNVILNSDVPPITTPYFAFYELDELGKAGRVKELYERMTAYWGGMLDRGAATFWEEYDPEAPAESQYDMYGDRFGKSLCHAWAASPLYLIGRYLVGLELTWSEETGAGFICRPDLAYMDGLKAEFPVACGRKTLKISFAEGILTVSTDAEDGKVVLGEDEYTLCPGRTYSFSLR